MFVQDNVLATSAYLSNRLTGITISAAGDMYLADTGNEIIRYINRTTGFIHTIAGTVASSGSTGDGELTWPLATEKHSTCATCAAITTITTKHPPTSVHPKYTLNTRHGVQQCEWVDTGDSR